MRNIGKVSRTWLREVEVHSIDDLRRCGVVATYRMIASMHPEVGRNLLWALEGAVHDVDWRAIPEARKRQLLAEVAHGSR